MNKLLLIILILIFGIVVTGVIFAEEFKSEDGIRLNEGKNIFNTSLEFTPIYVEDLIKLFPEIATISYIENEEEKGYVNVFGGIGENFPILPNMTYEIVSTKEVKLNLG